MNNSAYNHFKTIFENSKEFIICVDENLSVVYATQRVKAIFAKDGAPLLHLSSIFTNSQCNQVSFALWDDVHSTSFDSICFTENAPRHFVVFPMTFEDDQYLAIYISNTTLNAIDKLQKQDLEAMVDLSIMALVDCTVPIAKLAEKLSEEDYKIVMNNLGRLRKVFKNIELAATNHTHPTTLRVIELYDYMSGLLEKMKKRLGEDRFSYTMSPRIHMCLSLTRLGVLDLITVNMITEMFIRGDGKAHVHVMVTGDVGKNFIIISDSDSGLDYTADELIEQSDNESVEIVDGRIIAARTVAAKVARDNDCKAFFTTTYGGGVTHGLMLKRAKPRRTTLYEDAYESALQDEVLDIFLSDI